MCSGTGVDAEGPGQGGGSAGGGRWLRCVDGGGGLGEAGVGAAGAAVSLLSALDDAGHLQSCVHGEAAIPHLQGAVKWVEDSHQTGLLQ